MHVCVAKQSSEPVLSMSTRDLKPENILMHRANDSQTRGYVVKITDFGTQNRAVMMTLAVAVV